MSNKGLTLIIITLLVLCGLTFGAFYLKSNPDLALSQSIFGAKVAQNSEQDQNLESPFGNTSNDTNSNLAENTAPTNNSTNTLPQDSAKVAPEGNAEETVYPNTMTLPTAPTTTTPPKTTTSTKVSITLVLKKGSKGAEVKILQQFLIDGDYLTGKADGIFGAMTETAVKKFQTEYKITADGIVDGQTRTTINELLAA